MIRVASAARRSVRKRIREGWERQWERETTARPTKRLIRTPEKKALELYKGLPKPYAAILIQMRSMRISLRHFLHKIKEALASLNQIDVAATRALKHRDTS